MNHYKVNMSHPEVDMSHPEVDMSHHKVIMSQSHNEPLHWVVVIISRDGRIDRDIYLVGYPFKNYIRDH